MEITAEAERDMASVHTSGSSSTTSEYSWLFIIDFVAARLFGPVEILVAWVSED